MCDECGAWVEGYVETEHAEHGENWPCRHRGYGDVCPSWSPVDGCVCAKYGYPEHRSPLTDVGAAEANQDQREPVS